MPRTPAGAIKLQRKMAGQVVARDDFDDDGRIERVCGVDVSYGTDRMAYCAAVVMDLDFNVISQAATKSRVTQPYIPGLFMLREACPVLRTLRLVDDYDLVMVDGHGQLHPRRCGLACLVGVVLDKPAVGVAKSRLCGTVKDDGSVELLGGQVLGRIVNGQYVSVGHRISLATAALLVGRLSKSRVPEPLRLADLLSKRKRREGSGRQQQHRQQS